MIKIRIREALAERKITYFQLHTMTGIAESTVSRIVAGKQSPSIELIGKIADALQCPIDELLIMDSTFIECPYCHKKIRVEVKK